MRNNGLVIFGMIALMACFFHGCASAPEHEGVRAVAVWDLENLSPGSSTSPDLGQVLSGEIIQAIKQSGDIQVVEREKLVAVMEELKLGSSDLADDSARLRVGRMIGAREMVFGGYMVVGNAMRLDLRRVDVETGKVVRTAKRSTDALDLGKWVFSAREAAEELYGTGK